MRKYSEISGDYNPLHFDEAFAAHTKFGRLVVQGGLTTGLLHALVAMDMPGPGHGVPEPELEVHGAGLHRRHDHRARRGHRTCTPQAGHEAAITVTRQTGEVVLEGEATCYTFG